MRTSSRYGLPIAEPNDFTADFPAAVDDPRTSMIDAILSASSGAVVFELGTGTYSGAPFFQMSIPPSTYPSVVTISCAFMVGFSSNPQKVTLIASIVSGMTGIADSFTPHMTSIPSNEIVAINGGIMGSVPANTVAVVNFIGNMENPAEYLHYSGNIMWVRKV